jgi:hypothetical protein
MSPNKGHVFLVPTCAGDFVPGQVVALEKRGMLCISCGLFDQRVSGTDEAKHLPLDETKCFSTLLATPSSFNDGWSTIRNERLVIPKRLFPFENELSKKRGIGSKIYDPGIIEDFVDAFYGLKPWNMYFKADYFDKMLLSPDKKPAFLVYK